VNWEGNDAADWARAMDPGGLRLRADVAVGLGRSGAVSGPFEFTATAAFVRSRRLCFAAKRFFIFTPATEQSLRLMSHSRGEGSPNG
jgi:hypothetical protein